MGLTRIALGRVRLFLLFKQLFPTANKLLVNIFKSHNFRKMEHSEADQWETTNLAVEVASVTLWL